jgi:hypothetical protein
MFVSIILLAGATIGVSSILMDFSESTNKSYENETTESPYLLAMDETTYCEKINLLSIKEEPFISDMEDEIEEETGMSAFGSFYDFQVFVENNTRTPSPLLISDLMPISISLLR